MEVTPKIIDFLKVNIEDTETLIALQKLFYYYQYIDSFLRISTIEGVNNYKQKYIEFKQHLIHYKEAAKKTILTNTIIGDNETFYKHALFYYYLQLIKKILEEYQMSISIFNL